MKRSELNRSLAILRARLSDALAPALDARLDAELRRRGVTGASPPADAYAAACTSVEDWAEMNGGRASDRRRLRAVRRAHEACGELAAASAAVDAARAELAR